MGISMEETEGAKVAESGVVVRRLPTNRTHCPNPDGAECACLGRSNVNLPKGIGKHDRATTTHESMTPGSRFKSPIISRRSLRSLRLNSRYRFSNFSPLARWGKSKDTCRKLRRGPWG